MIKNVPLVARLIAVVGLAGAGKSEVVSFFSTSLGYSPLYFGGVVLAEAKAQRLPPGPESERHVREELREKFGMEAMAVKAYPELVSLLDSGKNVVIDGLYSMAEWEYLQRRLSQKILLIAVSAHRHLRYLRLANRSRRPLSETQINTRDFSEIEKLDKARPIVLADFQLTNNGDFNDLATELEAILRQIEIVKPHLT